jgi:hypothetical protein
LLKYLKKDENDSITINQYIILLFCSMVYL